MIVKDPEAAAEAADQIAQLPEEISSFRCSF